MQILKKKEKELMHETNRARPMGWVRKKRGRVRIVKNRKKGGANIRLGLKKNVYKTILNIS